MVDERTLLEYITPNPNVFASSIFIPQIEENNLDFKPALINMTQNSLQFGGTPSEDPNSHIGKFLRLIDTIRFNGASTNAIRLKLFPFSMTEKSPSRRLGNAFKVFFESAYTMAIKCTNWCNYSIKGLSIANRSMIDAACGGGILRRPPTEIYKIMGDLASNTHQWASQDRQLVKKKETPAGMYHVDQQTMLTSQIEAINKKLKHLC
ncbi:hypothetical protein SESBI_13770 [Sesbania bispinosa]|nr:hypothetical protein SESBI_13770 [Sesbania bispinosa]